MADRRPLIAIPARFSQSASALRFGAEVAARKLVEAVFDAGGEPLVVHPGPLADGRLWFADGLLLPGGGDLSAHWAGQDRHHADYDVDVPQDEFDLAVARLALDDRIPLLAICRGAQVVNVARGGNLFQDLPGHRHVVHTVTFELPDTARHTSPAGAQPPAYTELAVSCYHHQGIGRLGTGLRAVAFAADGTIEAVILDDHDGWFLGVQWHPEDTAATDPHQAAIFEQLVEAARLSRDRSPRWS
ncbi:gamma-glutamyl-gamma-aminobutyrate hydrolase family protein [Paractinoplanes rishiriensis]|uniref:Gamma-glutamyl-gamma-aminobutyrate hydrolase n=1 Tax=Paractinoplanes rishiriensis TaxID=1050105 RepID=A0A919MW12_9ACTN|nr:gamma-glutamyl-gamma-aminobutyrate hydrolase family protein [Actinoplanes rishiriensis]GIE94190.1 gamma-glutamyl-gamma-aminobutyrate hydrolase [Actinoplanes rishiriensis]